MTIKEFANLCECNPQTLRYYDSIDLLKPVNVDLWTGYRNYDESQGETYVNLLLMRNPGINKNLACNVDPSKDGQNHFKLYRKRTK